MKKLLSSDSHRNSLCSSTKIKIMIKDQSSCGSKESERQVPRTARELPLCMAISSLCLRKEVDLWSPVITESLLPKSAVRSIAPSPHAPASQSQLVRKYETGLIPSISPSCEIPPLMPQTPTP